MPERSSTLPDRAPRASVVVPFHRGLPMLERVIAALHDSTVPLEVIVVANGHDEDLSAVEGAGGVRVLTLPAPCGPAVARNHGAAHATGPVIVFVDADVVPQRESVAVMLEVLAREPDVAGVFGAYDHQPAAAGFYSSYRNLAHAFVHEQASPEAGTFWAGLGAVRMSAFTAVGGFDERFARPSIEDIDLGYRLRAAGYRLRLEVASRGTHLRGWTFGSSLVTDVRDRGVPWVQALFKYRALANDLNVSWRGRAAMVLASVAAIAAMAALTWPPAIWLALASAAGFLITQWPMLRWFSRLRGPSFAAGVLGGQVAHHLCSAASLVAGTMLWNAQRRLGWRTRWTLPASHWSERSNIDGAGAPQAGGAGSRHRPGEARGARTTEARE